VRVYTGTAYHPVSTRMRKQPQLSPPHLKVQNLTPQRLCLLISGLLSGLQHRHLHLGHVRHLAEPAGHIHQAPDNSCYVWGAVGL